MTILELGARLRSREISCVELIRQTLDDVAKRDQYKCLITLTAEEALAEAKERDRELASGVDRGPLHGIPTAHKDLFYTRGVRTTAGSLIFRDFVPDRDADVVAGLRSAGAISIGKANLQELAYGITSKNPHYGRVLNPLDTRRIPGGSSGGSGALIAAGFVPFSMGTDTGGSIRIPASYCGAAGLKPTYGLVSRRGVFPLAYSLDHVGPLGSSVADCALVMNAISKREFRLPTLRNFENIRIGAPKNFYFDRLDAEVADAVRQAASMMNAREIQVPDIHRINAAARVVQYAESASVYANYKDPRQFGADTWALLEQGKLVAGHEYVSAQRLRSVFRRQFDALWNDIDVLVTPTTPITAPLSEAKTVEIDGETEDTRMATTRLVRAVNFLGNPALSLPCGKDSNGMPIGLQLIGPRFSEPLLLQVGSLLEAISSGKPDPSIARQPPSSDNTLV